MAKYIFFIHGLSGNPKKTWGNFPDYLKGVIELEYTIDHLDYKSPSKLLFWKSAPSLLNIAEAHILKLQNKCNLENDEIVLIGHSNGGVVIKKLLSRLEFKKIKHNISKVCFLDVPHQGSGYATPGKVINPRNKHLKSLSLNSPELVEINDFWLFDDYHKKFDILNLVAEDEDVVSASSSRFCYPNSLVIPDTDHGSIAKPISSDSIVVTKVFEFISNKKSLAKYYNSSSENFRDWLLHDGGRRHGYSFVTDDIRLNALNSLQESLRTSGNIVRITGLSGLGKTRLITEYIAREEELSEENILVFKASTHEHEVKTSVKQAIRDGAFGLIVIEHCSVALHDYLATEIFNHKSGLRVITVNFYDDEVTSSPHIHLTELNDDSVSELIKPMLPQFNVTQILRIVAFVEGFPLLAILIAERFRDEGVLSSQLTERDFADKLINGDGELTIEQKRILQVCSLFDVFGIEAEGVEQADYIISIAKSSRETFGQVVNQFERRRIINRVGRYARIVPKPLAIHLASMWWDNNIHDDLEGLINSLPESLISSFCTQIKYLDSSKKVHEFVGRLCEKCSPFGQAELLLSKKGSRLFRALVEVNPTVTSDSLFRVFSSLSGEEIADITGDVRRNLVWSLEMLVFHSVCFDKAAWCLFKLAQFENESYGNNATGQFSQLFRWQLSGTEASFTQRLAILDRALGLECESADIIILEAIKAAISTHSGTRTVGAEFQGTKPELKEWMPKLWQEIYDYWQSLFDILLVLIKRGQLVEQVKDAFGHEIRGLMRYKHLEQLDIFIKEVIKLTGKYWPAAAQSIIHALQYDADGMAKEQLSLLKSWERLLAPDENNLEEKLKLIVLNPSREHEKDDDGHYINVAAEDAKKLSRELKDSHAEIISYLDLLMTFPSQKQSWVFAKHLVLESDDFEVLLTALLDYLRTHNKIYSQFVSGFLTGLYAKNSVKWKDVIELIAKDEHLIEYYPDSIRTGAFDLSHLNIFIELIKTGQLSSDSASMLVYGGATDHLTEDEIAEFCMSLSVVDPTAVWVALDNIKMYTHGRKNLNREVLNPVLTHLVLNVSFKKENKSKHSDSYNWLSSVKTLLKTENEEFALKLCLRLIDQVGNNDVDYSDLWDYLGDGFYKAFEIHGDFLWPIVADKFIDSSVDKPYLLIELLGSGKSYKKRDNSIFDILDPDIIIDWCQDEVALLIVGRAISMFISNDDKREVNPLMIRMLSEFADNNAFVSEVSANFNSRSWGGSLVPYLEADKALISPLRENSNAKVRLWAVSFIENLDSQIQREMKNDAEENMLRNY